MLTSFFEHVQKLVGFSMNIEDLGELGGKLIFYFIFKMLLIFYTEL